MSREEGGFFYYLALLIGMSLIGAYMWYTLTTPATVEAFHFSSYYQFILFMSGIVLLASSFLFAYTKTRTSRVAMTAVCGVTGGVHFFLDISMYDMIPGIILFAWMAFGILLAFAAFNWLLE